MHMVKLKTEEYDERGKHKTKSVITKQPVTDQMWADHLLGSDPALGIIPINEDSKCKWACLDVDDYSVDLDKISKQFINKNLLLCR